jgi:hypothetical protein
LAEQENETTENINTESEVETVSENEQEETSDFVMSM